MDTSEAVEFYDDELVDENGEIATFATGLPNPNANGAVAMLPTEASLAARKQATSFLIELDEFITYTLSRRDTLSTHSNFVTDPLYSQLMRVLILFAALVNCMIV